MTVIEAITQAFGGAKVEVRKYEDCYVVSIVCKADLGGSWGYAHAVRSYSNDVPEDEAVCDVARDMFFGVIHGGGIKLFKNRGRDD